MGVQYNEDRWGVMEVTLDPASVAANTTAEQDFTVKGLTTDMMVDVNKPSLTAGVGIVNARVKAADTLAITFVNATASGVDPASEAYKVRWWLPERAGDLPNQVVR